MAAAGGTVSGPSSACKPGRSSTGAPSTAADSKLSNQVSTIVSLLSTLCRGSPVVTHVRNHFMLQIYILFIFFSCILIYTRFCCYFIYRYIDLLIMKKIYIHIGYLFIKRGKKGNVSYGNETQF